MFRIAYRWLDDSGHGWCRWTANLEEGIAELARMIAAYGDECDHWLEEKMPDGSWVRVDEKVAKDVAAPRPRGTWVPGSPPRDRSAWWHVKFVSRQFEREIVLVHGGWVWAVGLVRPVDAATIASHWSEPIEAPRTS